MYSSNKNGPKPKNGMIYSFARTGKLNMHPHAESQFLLKIKNFGFVDGEK